LDSSRFATNTPKIDEGSELLASGSANLVWNFEAPTTHLPLDLIGDEAYLAFKLDEH
jgi:hypothetical protein